MSKTKPPTCRKCKVDQCENYGPVGGFSVQCVNCNNIQCEKRRAASKKRKIMKFNKKQNDKFWDSMAEATKEFASQIELKQDHDPVNKPSHYVNHPSGIECIQITEHMGFCLGNAVKYIWRADLKNDAIEDLKKAQWYLNREIEKREKQK